MIKSGPSSGSGSGSGSFLAYSCSLVLFISVFNLFYSSSRAACYFPNGSDENYRLSNDVYQPCDPGDEHSMCCALNRTVADKCRKDGLCLSTYDSNIWRGGCTDSTWKSSSCVKLCAFEEGIQKFHETIPLKIWQINGAMLM